MNKETLFYKMWNLNKKKLPIYLLTILVIVVAVVVAAIPGALLLMRRADAQVALGNAKFHSPIRIEICGLCSTMRIICR